jgi:hypothetical protein
MIVRVPSFALRAEGDCAMTPTRVSRVPRMAALTFIILGFLLNICGQVAESGVDMMPQSAFRVLKDGTAVSGPLDERLSRAKSYQFAGFMFILSGATVWLCNRYVELKRQIRLSRYRGGSACGS